MLEVRHSHSISRPAARQALKALVLPEQGNTIVRLRTYGEKRLTGISDGLVQAGRAATKVIADKNHACKPPMFVNRTKPTYRKKL